MLGCADGAACACFLRAVQARTHGVTDSPSHDPGGPEAGTGDARQGKSSKLELALGLLNGAVGDYLARTGNALAMPMALMHEGAVVEPTPAGLAQAYPRATRRAVLLVHGLMTTEAVWRFREGGDYGTLLSRDLGFTPLYLRYNSGRAIPENGAELSSLLERVVAAWPVELDELLLLGYSLGGLVIRSACHHATEHRLTWLSRVHKAIYVGTPHRGAPLERAGKVIARVLQSINDPYTRLVADIANLRSAGIQDLGTADLREEDRVHPSKQSSMPRSRVEVLKQSADGLRQLSLMDPHHPVPLLPSIQHYLVAGTVSSDPLVSTFFGDAVVPVPSASDGGERPGSPAHHRASHAGQASPPGRGGPVKVVKVLPGLGHLELSNHPDIYALIRAWSGEGAP